MTDATPSVTVAVKLFSFKKKHALFKHFLMWHFVISALFYFGTMNFFSSNFFIFSHPTSPPSLSLIASVVPSSNRLFQNGFYFVE